MRISHAGAAALSKLVSGLGASAADLTIPCEDLTGWPDGTIGPFYASLGKGSNTEEKVLCSGRAGNTLAVWTDGISNGRGADGTSIKEHPVGEAIEHVWTAAEADAANIHLETTDGAHGYPNVDQIVTLTGTQEITGVKTLHDPVLDAPIMADADSYGGKFLAATHMTLAGAQAEAEFRVRNVLIGTGVPDNSIGNDGDLYIAKE